jgi:hypothetical protein
VPAFINVAASIEVRLRQDRGAGWTLTRLRVHQDHFQRLALRFPARRIRQPEVHREQREVQRDRQAERRPQHAVLPEKR